MLLLISPSRVMSMTHINKSLPAERPAFEKAAETLANEMRGFELEQMAKFMEEDDHMARETLDLFQKFKSAPSGQALFVYEGKVYKAMDPDSFSADQLKFASDHLRIISTLYGYLRPYDMIKEYRMNFHLQYENGNLYDFWRPKITPLLEKDAKDSGGVILNFAAFDVIKAVDVSKFSGNIRIIHVEFKDYKKERNEYVTIRAYAQPAKGKLIGYIVRHNIDNPEAVKDFGCDGYTYNKSLSTESEMIFTR